VEDAVEQAKKEKDAGNYGIVVRKLERPSETDERNVVDGRGKAALPHAKRCVVLQRSLNGKNSWDQRRSDSCRLFTSSWVPKSRKAIKEALRTTMKLDLAYGLMLAMLGACRVDTRKLWPTMRRLRLCWRSTSRPTELC
jgi:hypothetical protein